MSDAIPGTMHLVPVSGPAIEPLKIEPKSGGLVIGRSDQCDLPLPAQHAEKVSRSHARFDFDSQRWRVADLNSRWGTYVNGVRLAAQREIPLNEGDLIRITPWTFAFSAMSKRRGMATSDDVGRTMIRTFAAGSATGAMRDDTLALLLESAAAIHAAESEQKLAEVVMDSALRGT